MKNPLTTEAFIDWCAKKSGKYEYGCSYNCAIAQYLKSLGYGNVIVSGFGMWNATDIFGKQAHGKMQEVAFAAVRCDTFAELTARLRGGIPND